MALNSADVARPKNEETQEAEAQEVQGWAGRLRKRDKMNYKD